MLKSELLIKLIIPGMQEKQYWLSEDKIAKLLLFMDKLDPVIPIPGDVAPILMEEVDKYFPRKISNALNNYYCSKISRHRFENMRLFHLVSMKKKDLLNIRGLGVSSVQYIEKILDVIGLKLAV